MMDNRFDKERVEYAEFVRGLTNDQYVTYLKANIAMMDGNSLTEYHVNTKLLYVVSFLSFVGGGALAIRGLRILYAKRL